MDAIDAETYDGWRDFLMGLRERGLSGVMRVASDAHGGPRRAIREAFPGSAWQRCVAHLMRGAAGKAPARQKRAAVLKIAKAALAERDPELVRELHHGCCFAYRNRSRGCVWLHGSLCWSGCSLCL